MLAASILPPLVDMQVDFSSFALMIVLSAIFAIFWPYAGWRGMKRLQAGLEVGLSAFLLTAPLLVLTYVAMRFNAPLADPWLAGIDAALGFDAPTMVRAVGQYDWLALILNYAYVSFTPQIIILPIILCLIGNHGRGYAMVVAFMLLGVLTTVIAGVFPAVGAYTFYGIGPKDLGNINGASGYHFLTSFAAVRDGTDFTLRLPEASGILTFPSFHAGVAALCIWAAWGVRWLRWPSVMLNLAMIASAITHGAHYLVDLLAGVFLAALTVLIVRRMQFPLRQSASAPDTERDFAPPQPLSLPSIN